jgi:asparagine synthase (glutamine-hydrolysing)
MSTPPVSVELTASGWETSGGTSVRGQAHVDGRFHAAADLARMFDAIPTERQWQRVLLRCNGSFAIVTRRADAVLAAVDRVRSIPLFYCANDGRARVSDVALRALEGSREIESNPLGDIEFQLTGYVTGDETLVGGLHQVQAGESLCWHFDEPEAPSAWQYHTFEHGDYFTTDTTDLVGRLSLVHEAVFRRLAESVSGRQLVIPLSGGYDSRLIGISLRDLGVRDVVCYSYGLPGNWESGISHELARYLGFRWEFVPYSVERWRQWASTPRFADYFQSAGNLASVPHIQDWPAVWELTRERRVAPDSVFVPGHSGDFLAGSHIPPHFLDAPMVRRRAFFEALLSAHYSLWDWPRDTRPDLREVFTRRVEAVIGHVGDVSAPRAADLFEQWDLKERQAKFICNSVRAYESFDHEWRLPLFDHELMDFWARVPAPLRVGRKLYFEFARERQQVPVTAPNTDRGALQRAMVRGIAAAGLKPLARRLRRAYRTWHWRDEYVSSSLGWFSIVDEEFFRRTYNGKQLFHSYMTRAYRNWVLAPPDGESVIPGLATR